MELQDISEENMNTIAEMVADKLKPAIAPATTPPATTAPVPEGEQAMTMEGMTALLKSVVENNTTQNNEALFDTMFSDKLSSAQGSIPGFSEFLEGEDDFGDTRLAKLSGIADYTKRVSALDTLSSRFKAASSHVPGATHVTPAQQQAFDKTQEGYKGVTDKFLSGDLTPGDFSEAMLTELSKELDAVMG